MFKLLFFVFLISPFANSSSAYIGELKEFYQGLEKRQLLLRHQVSRAIVQMEKADTPQKKEQVFQKNRSFFKYLLSSVGTMNVNTASKSYIKNGLQGLVETSLEPKANAPVQKTVKLNNPEKKVEKK